ncbi:sacsin isoform X5 [Mauremys reevesii]|uniref:sacsin isoform X5 n=1 Tax=Mauremys reevesii TaxID=260615 RepID=UPI00193F8C4D|nr:sacsin isoform X5 [Mauremys reevesii]
MKTKDKIRLARVTVLHDCLGCKTFEVPPSAAVGHLKALINSETGFPVAEQKLWHLGRELSDCTKVGDCLNSENHIFLNLQSKGLKGGGRFGQTTPPLVDFLKDILRRYPEGGQILKELIQNAEDAGATEVRFLYDETQYGTESLWSKDMAQYQGPALYVYNNAVFTLEDWHGIQEIARSKKKDDPLKVGRFGIGFNSVYHITDVPSIFSGDQIGMLDPHQTLFGSHESGQCWNLKDDSKEIIEFTDQFAPFIGVFGSTKETFKNGNFPGTFFRFPLRLQPSQLSSNLYNKQKVLELFESFRADADTVLLFLKSVQDVSLHVREADGIERLVFRVTASENKALKHERPNSIKILGTAISQYCKGVPSNSVTCVTYHVNIVLEDESVKDAQKTSWLVCNSVGGRGICNELDCLADDLKFVPTIGIAMSLSSNGEEKGAVAEFSGRAFCFLPLPPGEESKTGLPVHVSGFFGLTDNRRSIKWRELDQWRDPAALWNDLLVVNVVPKAYATLILEAIKRMETEKNSDFPLTAERIYRLWPEKNKIRVHWKPIIEPLFKELLQNAVIYSASSDWIKVEQVCFSDMDDSLEYTQTVLNYLQSSGNQIATVPANIASAVHLTVSSSKTVKKVTPAGVRQVLRKSGHTGPANEKLHLLEFVLTDGVYSELIGLELLPLQNGNFIPFSSSVSDQDVVYITSEDYPRSLFPGLEGRLLSDDLKPQVLTALKEAAKSRGRPCTQLQLLNPERFARLIKEVLNTVWPGRDMVVQWYPVSEDKNHPSISWLKMVWKNLYIHFSEDLTMFDDMPLIPKMLLEEDQVLVELIRLRTPPAIILEDESETQLPGFLADIIQKLGGVVLKKLDASIQHPLLKKYVHPPLPGAVLQIMEKLSLQKLSSQVSSLPPTHKDALRGFLASLTDASEKERRIIQELLIFKRIQQSSDEGVTAFTGLKGCKVLHHTAKLPPSLRLSIPIIDSSDEATIRLANLLKVEQLKSTDCLKFIIQDIQNDFYSYDETIQIMLWVLENLTFLKNENTDVLDWLSSLKFIRISQGKIVSANELFDPEVEVLQNLFYAEEEICFPPSIFTASSDILHSLRQIGLKNESDLEEKDIMRVANKIESLQGDSCTSHDVLLRKARTLLMILNKNHMLLQSAEAKSMLKKLKWIPACKERPPNYPGSLVWKGDLCNFCSPPEMCNIAHAILVGSSVPFVESVHLNIEKALGISTKPGIKAVLKHFKVVVDWHSSKTFSDEDYYQFQHILLEIYGFMHDHLEEGKDAFKALKFPWVWTGKTFCSLTQAVINSVPDLDLQPYLHSVPKTMAKFHQLFKSCGSIEQLTPDHVSMVIQKIYLKSEQSLSEEESKQNLHIMLNIIRWLYSSQIPASLNTPVPIYCIKCPFKLVMKPIHECCYCDIKVDDLNDLLEDSVEPIILVHEDIPMKTAEWLNVPCLSTRLINPENMGFEQSGQREPLTVRIKNILEEYPSVSDIFKELLQNADDANATECNFMIDMRRNMNIRENLLDPGMAACHGPALWSFNNSEFSDSDFLNITRLGESLKREEVDKVGKFGLGFNSVYHITDIPIIMSREFMIMFDPNINHLSKHIRDKSNPGIKINWSKQQKRLRKFPNQFKPFIGVFGCHLPLTVEAPYSYKGTLFRLSFRTQQEAKVSEVSSTCYNTADIYSLVDEFSICGHRLIIFTQSVNSMVLKYLKVEEADPGVAQDTVTIKKSLCSSKALTAPVVSVLKEAAKLMKTCSSSNRKLPTETPKSSCILQIIVEEFHHVFRRIADLQSPLFRGPEDDPSSLFEMAKSGQMKRPVEELPQKTVDSSTWLICSCMDTGDALKFSLHESGRRLGLVPCGGVGVLLSETQDQKWIVKPNCNSIGEVFCYLPLRIKTGLPVHINGCFAVTSNRKEIWKTDTKGRWNTLFMRHVIVKAYLEALCVLRDMTVNGELADYSYYAVWPDPDSVHDDFSVICQGFYEDIAHAKGKEGIKVFSDGSSWVSMKNVRFLDDSILKRSDIGPAAFKIFLKYLKKTGSKNLCAVALPSWVKAGFEEAGCKYILLENTFSERQFFSEVFFPNIQEIDAELRDPLMRYVLNEKVEEFSGILCVTPCIPCSLDRHSLVIPSRLIHPEGRVAKLYDAKDGRFPYGSSQDYLNPVILVKLVQLGMAKDDISWEDLIERAESVAAINRNDHVAACLRSSIILSLIDEKLKCRDPRTKEFAAKCQTIPFLPFLTKPAGFSLHWKGSDFQPETMFSATDLFTADHQDTVCLLQPVLNENSHSFKGCGAISLAVKDFLGLLKKPTVNMVINQLQEVAKSFDGITLYQENITNACYKYLHEAVLQNETTKAVIIEKLKNFSFILVESAYVDPTKVCFHLNFEAAPYLHQLPNKYKNSFRELFESVGVRHAFTVDDFALVLESVNHERGSKQLTEENFQLCRRIISEGIWSLIRERKQELCEKKYGEILLPDIHLALLPAKSLCYNDCPWIKVKDTTVKYCHADIPREVAVKLGAVPKRHKALERYASNICFTTLGTEFGQKEKLTSRIKSILNAYPSEKEMLKELLQNADDAKATEICFVFDSRQHPVDRIFDEKWAPLQGPALCVYNNQPFTEDDIRGIQNLGKVNRLDLQPDWYCLVKAVYSCIHEDLKRLLPVVRAPNIDGSDLHSAVIITWVNMSTSNKGRPFFDNLLQDELHHLKNVEYITTRKTVAENVYRLKHLLLEIGFNLVYNCDETANLYHCLIDADIPVSYVTPADVRFFLMTFSSPDSNCHIGKLPCRLQQTNLKLFHSLKLLVDYCFKDAEENEVQIEGLPLLITLDNVLQVFDSKRPRFLTTYHELIPSRKDLFMNTLYLRYSNILLTCDVAKAFDVTSFADLLSSVLPREYKTRSCVRWKENFASESWLKNAWHFISESVNVKEDQEDMKPKFDNIVDTLKDWALLPGTKFTVSVNQLIVPECDVLVPLSLMHIAVFPNAQSDKVFHALMKTGCIQLALNKICSKDNVLVSLLSGYTANIDNPSSILKAIHYMVQTSTFKTEKLAESDFEALLMYFSCHLSNLMSQDDIKILKSLPCYKSISGRYISISKCGTCYILTKSIPSVEVDRWTQSTSSAFLEEKINLKDLYTVLGCVPVDDLEVYLKHLLPKIESLSYDAKVEHLIYLKNRLSGIEEASEIKEQLFEKLESFLIIHDASNRLKPAKHFYDRTVKVFQVMLPEKLFIPQDFFKRLEQLTKPKNQGAFLTSWVTFLRNIGLKYIISQQQLLQFAKEISMRANTESWSKETLQSTVDVLLHHIFEERTDLLLGNFLKELSLIPFLCPERAPAEIVRFHPQYQEINGTLPLIRFNGAQVNPKFKQTDVLQLLWTSCPILPEKATPLSIKEQEGSSLDPQEQLEQVLTMLNVNLDPPLDKVINNCRNICNITTLDEDMVKTRAKVLRSIYEFLSTEKREFRFQLRGVAFVMVEEGWKLLKPEEVVINLEYESDFKPYLYKLPLELGTFHQLFKHLGTEDVISTKQYVEVLSRIFKNSEGKQLDPNEMRTVKRVVSGLFKSLQNDSVKVRNDLENVRDLALYLPSQDGRLVKSSILVFDDAPHYKSRIQGNIGVQMLVDLSQCYLGKDHGFHTKLVMLFPQKLRPRLLSSILEELLDEESPKTCQFGALCSLQGRLQLLLSSEQFITGLIRIMKHENDNAFLANEEKAIKLCKALREGLKVSCFEKLQTTLRVKGFSPIPHSKSETFAFLKRFGNAVILLYIQHSDSKDINFLLALAMTLKSATDNLISDTSYLIAMLGCNDIYRISEKLDSLGVKYDSSEPSKLELPMPGTPIPAEIHYTLLMDPMNVFYPGEYVGYLVDAEGGDIYGSYQPTYTYAIIVQEVEREDDENSSFLGKIYQIDIGYSEYKIVSSLDLYKFSRPDESSQSKDSAPSTPTSPTEFPAHGPRTVPPLFSGRESHKTTSSKHHSPKKVKLNSLPEILREVTSVLEQAWKLPESERKKIIRRLYLKWHPDKNSENLDIANEVFKHLQNEINRLEKQAFIDQNTDRASRRTFSSSASRFQSDKFSFQRFYTSWNQEATSHKSERQQYKEKCPSSTGPSYSARFFVPPTFKSVGNPVEARRWLRQARANFSAARNDLHKNANEWVCFKCYLSTKLALIAADYAVRGKSDKDVKPTALAQKIEEYSQQLEGLTNDVQTLEAYGVDSLKTRYPDLLPFPQIPNDRFTSEVAMRVMECTACIIIKLENFIQQKV